MSRLPAGLLLVCVATAATALAAAAPARGQHHPNRVQGFTPEKAFELSGLENVNLFNGNLTLTLPLGPTYPVNGALAYGLTLTYSGNAWEFEEVLTPAGCADDCTSTMVPVPDQQSNAGLGWMVSLGRLDPPSAPGNDLADPLENPPGSHVYLSPDQAEHPLFISLHEGTRTDAGVFYTQDGSYMRLREVAGGATIEGRTVAFELDSPDGTTRSFDAGGELLEMRDPSGNRLRVRYETDANGAPRWVLLDSQGRTHRVHFASAPYYGWVVDRVELSAFGDAKATYTFEYTTEAVPRPCPGIPDDLGISRSVSVPLLASLRLPDASSFAMPQYNQDLSSSEDTSCSHAAGHLEALDLPTGGRLEWTWNTYFFGLDSARDRAFRSATGIAERRWLESATASAPESVWSYQGVFTTPGSGEDIVEFITSVTDPLGHQSKHYFSIYAVAGSDTSPPPPGADGSAWDERDYGLPFTRHAVSGGKYLSVQVFDSVELSKPEADRSPLRETYLTYDVERGPGELNPGGSNARVTSQRTVYLDDGSTKADVAFSDFDGLGNFRRVVTGGTFAGDNVRESVTLYNPKAGTFPGSFVLPEPSAPWILGTFTERTVTEAGRSERAELHFDEKGRLLRRRRLADTSLSPARGADDLLVVFELDDASDTVFDTPAAETGNVARELYYGGDGGGLGTGDLQDLALPATADYVLEHAYGEGVRSRTDYVDAHGIVLTVLDRQIDAATGLPKSSSDMAGRTTSFLYDTMGRLTRTTPPGDDALTQVSYRTSPPRVTIKRPADGSLFERQIEFDPFGRVETERRGLPESGLSERVTAYDAAGNVRRVSEVGAAGTAKPGTEFRRHDPFGRPAKIVAADGHEVRFGYKGVSRINRTVDGIATAADTETEATTVESYDRQGRLVKVEQSPAAGGPAIVARYGYDTADRLASVAMTDRATGVQQKRTFTYDGRGLLVAETHPELGASGGGRIDYLAYDARGHLLRKKQGGGSRDLTFVYDAAERLTQVKETAGPLWKELFYADTGPSAGQLVQSKRHNRIPDPEDPAALVDFVVTETFEHDTGTGRITSRQVRASRGGGGGGAVAFGQDFTWNTLGGLESHVYPACEAPVCTGVEPARTLTFGYAQDLLTSVTAHTATEATTLATLTYHPNLLVHQVVHSNGVTYTQENDPHLMHRPLSYSISGPFGGPATLGPYGYDGAGNVTAIGPEVYTYDLLSRITSGTLGGGESQSYTFDGFGNLATITTQFPGEAATTRTPTANPSTNRLVSPSSYDAFGNLTGWATFSYAWDPLDTLVRYTGDGNDRAYAYSADEERLLAIDYSSGNLTWRLRDLGNQVVREVERTADAWSWQGDWMHREGTLLAREQPAEGTTHLHPDHLGTPRIRTDEAGFPIGEQHHFFPFGEEPVPKLGTVMKFTGHERDANVEVNGQGGVVATDDLDYMHARYYSPLLGRFVNVDPRVLRRPTKVSQRWNRFLYAAGNPLKFIDPDGEDIKIVFDFRNSGLSPKQQAQVAVGIARRFRNAGVKRVQFFDIEGSVRPTIKKGSDRIVFLVFTSEPIATRPGVFGRTPIPGNESEITTSEAPQEESSTLNFLINVGSHEAGHASGVLPEHDNDAFPLGSVLNPRETAEEGSVMEQGVDAETLGEATREFDEEDSENLREHLNEPK